MDNELVYRCNVMSVNSLETFCNIRGGYYRGVRDVYFVRALGSKPSFEKEIAEIDRKMDEAMSSDRLSYSRISSLESYVDSDDMAFYMEQYQKWKETGRISIKNNKDSTFAGILGEACRKSLERYVTVKKNFNDSIERNYIIKMLFWTDNVAGEALADWNERKLIKIIAGNILKVQEFLFFYMLTMVGCDVLLLEMRSDIEVDEMIKSLSQELKLGSYTERELPEYARGTYEKTEQDKNNDLMKRTVINTETAKDERINNEKSFEELARLASSIVMITVLDNRRNPIATGSGIMIGRNGDILTNYHVIDGGRYFAVRIEEDEEEYVAEGVIKSNPVFDLAVIRINKELKPLTIFGGGEVVRGQKVVAIGSPLGLFNSVSDGIISGFRTINDVDMIQFTAPISHGSSGGAVLNLQGEVIGISTAGMDKGQNLNLAVHYEIIAMFVRGLV